MTTRAPAMLWVASCCLLVGLGGVFVRTVPSAIAATLVATPRPAFTPHPPITPSPPPSPTSLPTPSPSPTPSSASVPASASASSCQPVSGESPREAGHCLLLLRWSESHWRSLDSLWTAESGWSPTARNRSSSACGIPQRHPCPWKTMPPAREQIRVGLDYIASRYGSPQSAYAHFRRSGSY